MALQAAKRTAPPAVEVAFHRVGIAIVTLRGEHDLNGELALSNALVHASDQLNVLIDLSECSFMDSSVIAAFIAARTSLAERGGRLEIVIPPEATTVERFAQLSHLADLLPIHATRSAGIATFQRSEHLIQIRDLRLRFGDPEAHAAQCYCGWLGETRAMERQAERDGTQHVDRERLTPRLREGGQGEGSALRPPGAQPDRTPSRRACPGMPAA